MRRWFIGFLASCSLCACGAGQPPTSERAPQLAAASALDLSALEGRPYAQAAAEPSFEPYAPEALGISGPDQTRFAAAMGAGEPGRIMEGGGAEALVFFGCAGADCQAGAAVLAIDTRSGAVFVGVRDAAGADKLAPNDRLEALLRLNSPARRWDDPAPSPLDRERGLP